MSYFRKGFHSKSWSGGRSSSIRDNIGRSLRQLKRSTTSKSNDPALDDSIDENIGSRYNSFSRSSIDSEDLCCSSNMLTYCSSKEGKMHSNEDRWVSMKTLSPEFMTYCDSKLHAKADIQEACQFLSCTSLFAAIDGHDGAGCSQFLSENLARMVVTCEACYSTELLISDRLSEIMREVFVKMEKEFMQEAEKTNDTSGACIVIVLCCGDWICAGNAGDCLGVLYDHSKKIHYISKLHRSIIGEERARVEGAGGFIERGRVFGQMIPSRTIGDFDIKKSCPGAVIAEPYITTLEIKKRKETLPIMILATDGLWDIYDAKMACKAARKYLKQKVLKDFAVDPSYIMCEYAVEGGTKDDVTTIIVKL
mmetsp:Transcript_19541/g.25274  ORF Transcript_19541/g.25274 Transcript_19541/m.25274 type:complete len:365 (-) Transcript_19541:537-1631(-)